VLIMQIDRRLLLVAAAAAGFWAWNAYGAEFGELDGLRRRRFAFDPFGVLAAHQTGDVEASSTGLRLQHGRCNYSAYYGGAE
jgi:hypothetical protein